MEQHCAGGYTQAARLEVAMPIPKQSLSSITEADLQALVVGGAREDKTLDFKRDAYGGNDDAKGEFLADVSAFANTVGGDIVIGMDEADGAASALVGLADTIDPDAEVLRLQQMATAGIQPHLQSLDMVAVRLASGRHAIVVRAGRSFSPPHRVVFKGRNRFWVRGPAGRFEPDVDGLRTLFSAAPALGQRMRELRGERLRAILAGETPVPVQPEAGLLVLQLVPFASLDSAPIKIDVRQLERNISDFQFFRGSGLDYRTSFDGFATYQPVYDGKSSAYALLDRRGFAEVVTAQIIMSGTRGRQLLIDEVAAHLVHHVTRLVPLLRKLGAPSPISVLLGLVGVRSADGVLSQPGNSLFPRPSAPLERDVLAFVDAVIPEDAGDRSALIESLNPIFEQIAQTGGLSSIPAEWVNSR